VQHLCYCIGIEREEKKMNLFGWFGFKKTEKVEKPLKLCINCRFCEVTESNTKTCYGLPATIDKVTGRKQYGWCRSNRDYSFLCGEEAKFFEPIPEPEVDKG